MNRLFRRVAKKRGERRHQVARVLFRHLSAGLNTEATKVVSPRLPDREGIVEEHLDIALT